MPLLQVTQKDPKLETRSNPNTILLPPLLCQIQRRVAEPEDHLYPDAMELEA